jgi:O-6-methylguanine DNA methyltransferase
MPAALESNCWQLPLVTSEGVFTVEITLRGVSRLRFPHSKTVLTSLRIQPPPKVRSWQDLTLQALQCALQGSRSPARVPFDWPEATPFRWRVWEALRRIPPGKTVSYGELARRIGAPGAARAIGSACGANPVPVLIPCHRVLAANGRLGGFSGGLQWKRRLLEIEGVSVA